jgi:hypothetical protein
MPRCTAKIKGLAFIKWTKWSKLSNVFEYAITHVTNFV